MNTSHVDIAPEISKSWKSRLFPVALPARLIVLATLPMCLFLAHLAISMCAGSAISGKIAFLSFIGIALVAKWGLIGLCASSALLVATFFLSSEQITPLAWHLAYASSLMLNWYLTHLCFGEMTLSCHEMTQTLSKHKQDLDTTTHLLREQECAWINEREHLQQELEKIKNEAAQREIELKEKREHLLLLRSEIELLTSQKEDIVRQGQQQHQHALELFRQIEHKEQELARFEHEKQHLYERIARAERLEVEHHSLQQGQQMLMQLQEKLRFTEEELAYLKEESRQIVSLKEQVRHIARLKEEKAQDSETIELLKHNRDQVILLTEQLQEQIAKNKQLESAKQDSSANEAQLQQLIEKNNEILQLQQTLKGHLETQHLEVTQLKEQLLHVTAQHEAYPQPQELTCQNEEITRLTKELEKEQEQVKVLRAHIEQLERVKAEDLIDVGPHVKQELARTEGLYKQLRVQFQEKSRVLDQTRTELFKLEGELEAVKRDKDHQALSGADADDEIHLLVEGLKECDSQIAQLSVEVESLEDFIAHLMAQE